MYIVDRHLAEMPIASLDSRKTGRYTPRHAGHAGRVLILVTQRGGDVPGRPKGDERIIRLTRTKYDNHSPPEIVVAVVAVPSGPATFLPRGHDTIFPRYSGIGSVTKPSVPPLKTHTHTRSVFFIAELVILVQSLSFFLHIGRNREPNQKYKTKNLLIH